MHNFIKFSLAASLFFLLCGCGHNVKIEAVDKSYSTETVTVNANIPQIRGLDSEELESAVNDEFMSVTAELLEKFSKEAKQTGEQSRFDMQTNECFNKNGLFSMVTDYEFFAHKAHKNRFRIAKNIDTKNCIELSLSGLFDDDGYIDGINKLLSDAVAAEPEKYSDLWARPKIMQNQGFYIDGESLMLYYPPYELSYYERGYVEIPVPIEELLTYMHPEYREAFAE